MKNENIQKINKLGKVSRILINIFRVCVIIAIVAVPIATIIFMCIPNDSLEVTGSCTAQIVVKDSIVERFMDIDMDEADFEGKLFGTKYKWLVTEEKGEDVHKIINVDGAVDNLELEDIKLFALAFGFAAELVLVCLLVALIYAKKLAVALEKCNSPFEEEVLKGMKSLGIALAIWAGSHLVVGGISGIVAAFGVIVVLLFISIFKYGAQLQQESDETL